MITVYDDAPEENNEYAEPQTCEGDGIRLYFRAVGEVAAMLSCGGIFAKGEYIHPLRLESKLSDLRVGYANSHLATQDKFES